MQFDVNWSAESVVIKFVLCRLMLIHLLSLVGIDVWYRLHVCSVCLFRTNLCSVVLCWLVNLCLHSFGFQPFFMYYLICHLRMWHPKKKNVASWANEIAPPRLLNLILISHIWRFNIFNYLLNLIPVSGGILYRTAGEWNGAIEITREATNETQSFDTKRMRVIRKRVRPVQMQEDNESRRWGERILC